MSALSIPFYWYFVPGVSVIALFMALYFFKSMMKKEEGTSRMKEIAQYVREGAFCISFSTIQNGFYCFLCLIYNFHYISFFRYSKSFRSYRFFNGRLFLAFVVF